MSYFKLIHIMLSTLIAISTPYASASNSSGRITTPAPSLTGKAYNFEFTATGATETGIEGPSEKFNVEVREVKVTSEADLIAAKKWLAQEEAQIDGNIERVAYDFTEVNLFELRPDLIPEDEDYKVLTVNTNLFTEAIEIMDGGQIETLEVDKRSRIDRIISRMNQNVRKEYTVLDHDFTISDYNITLGVIRLAGVSGVMAASFIKADPNMVTESILASLPFGLISGVAFQMNSNFVVHWSYREGNTYNFLKNGQLSPEMEAKIPKPVLNRLKSFNGFEELILKNLEKKGITGEKAQEELHTKLQSAAFLAKYIGVETVLLNLLIGLTQGLGLAEPMTLTEYFKEFGTLMAYAIGTQYVWENIFFRWHEEKKQNNNGNETSRMQMTVAAQMFALSVVFNGAAALSQLKALETVGDITLATVSAVGLSYEAFRIGRGVLQKAIQPAQEKESRSVRATRKVLNSCASFLGKMLPAERITEDVRFQQQIQDMAN